MSRANARIYRKAARKVTEEKYNEYFTCNILRRSAKPELHLKYQKLFGLGDGFNSNCNDLWKDGPEHKTNRRVLMLCLAAAIEFDGEI